MASGGMSTGLDVARGIVLGATCGGLAGAIMSAAVDSADRVEEELRVIIEELKATMFLTGCGNLKELSAADYLITGRTGEWLLDHDEVL